MMWIKINANGGPKISIPVPLFLAGMPFVWRMIAKSNAQGDGEVDETSLTEWSGAMQRLGPKAIRDLRQFIHRNGHFTMVDIETADGDTVKITV